MEKGKALVIGIAGGSASGKTTLCNKLAEILEKESPKVFHMDEYFKPEELRPRVRALTGDREYVDDNHPDTMYHKRKRLRQNKDHPGGRPADPL